jgi:hypothetical protein
MEEIEIPLGAMTFYSGMFYKINMDKLFHYKNGEWRRSSRSIEKVKINIKEIPNILESIHGTAIAWDEHNNKRKHSND